MKPMPNIQNSMKKKTKILQIKGFSFVELLVAMAISIMLVLALGNLTRTIYVFYESAQSSQFAQGDSISVLRTMVATLRTASISNTGSYPLINTGSTSLSFYSDMQGNGTKEQIQYYLKGVTLYENILTPTGSPLQYTGASTTNILIKNVANGTSTPVFEYYDGNYDGTTAALTQPVNVSNVRLVKITALVNTVINNQTLIATATSQVSFRNLKNNL
jgi:Tfp pilus assembly protein PilW